MSTMKILGNKTINTLKILTVIAVSKFILSNRKPQVIILIASAIVVIIFIAAFGLSRGKSRQTSIAGVNNQRIEVTSAKATQSINRTFTFPLKDSKSVEVAKFKYVITDVQLQDEIIVKGQRATAIKGRTFLIINLKIINDSSLTFEINTRDYIRMSIEGNKEQFAGDIHNDPVQVQAISTKPTRLGFPINDNNKKFILYVGEIKGEKQSININL